MLQIQQRISNAWKKYDYEILFTDSPEYFEVKNAKMIIEGPMVRFLKFSPANTLIEDEWYPLNRIHRIKRYYP